MNKTDELLEALGNNRQFVVNSFYDATENYGHKKIVVLPHEDGGYPDVYLCFKDKNDKLGEFASWTRDEFEADEKLVEAVAQIADTIYSETVDTINWEIEQGVRNEFRFIAYDDPTAEIKIYQLPVEAIMAFRGFDDFEKHGFEPHKSDYELKYSFKVSAEEVKDVNSFLEETYTKLNVFHPKDYHTRSLSVSDVVVISANNETNAYFVDTFGFKPVPEFANESGKTYKPMLMMKENTSLDRED